MDWMNRESMDRQVEDYNSALNKLLAVCPKLKPGTNNHNSMFPLRFEMVWNVDKNSLIAAANEVIVKRAEILETPTFRGPTRIKSHTGPGTTIWDYNFFEVSFSLSVTVNRFGWEPGTLAGAGRPIQEQRIASYKQSMTLVGAGGNWGLGSWYKRARDIRHYADAATAEIQEAYMEYYEKACEDVKIWEQLSQQPKEVLTIPKPENPDARVDDARLVSP